MVKWENVCLPRDFGGAGIINTRHLNEALVLKWVWRMQNLEEDDSCCKLLKAKYFSKQRFHAHQRYRGVAVLEGCT
jgi:hypothetical protein